MGTIGTKASAFISVGIFLFISINGLVDRHVLGEPGRNVASESLAIPRGAEPGFG